jgi:hypothetical protein
MQEMPRRRLVSRFGNILTAGALITVSGFGFGVGFKLTGASESAGNDDIARLLGLRKPGAYQQSGCDLVATRRP